MPYVTTTDGTSIYYKDWGKGETVVFSHGWPLCSDAWDAHMLFLVNKGYRCIAHDRRGHGRSSQPSFGNDMDTYADDLEAVMAKLDIKNATFVGHSTGGGEVARYVAKHGQAKGRAKKAVLVSAIPPLMLKTVANPGGLPSTVFDDLRKNTAADRSQFFKDLSGPFFGANRAGSKATQGMRDSFWFQGLMGGLINLYECVKVFSETDQTEDLKKITVPVLLVHGTDDQIVPIDASARAGIKLLKHGTLKEYEGAAYGLPETEKDKLNAELLAFIQS